MDYEGELGGGLLPLLYSQATPESRGLVKQDSRNGGLRKQDSRNSGLLRQDSRSVGLMRGDSRGGLYDKTSLDR